MEVNEKPCATAHFSFTNQIFQIVTTELHLESGTNKGILKFFVLLF